MTRQRGFSLIETTVAIALLAVIVVAILSAFSATTLDRLTRSNIQYNKSQPYSVNNLLPAPYQNLSSSGYTFAYQVLYYSALTNPPNFQSGNPDVGLQEIILTVRGPNGSMEVVDFLKEQP